MQSRIYDELKRNGGTENDLRVTIYISEDYFYAIAKEPRIAGNSLQNYFLTQSRIAGYPVFIVRNINIYGFPEHPEVDIHIENLRYN